jgi:hypothetical protein
MILVHRQVWRPGGRCCGRRRGHAFGGAVCPCAQRTSMRGVSASRSRSSPSNKAVEDRNTFLTNAFVLKAMRGDTDAVRTDVSLGRNVDSIHSVRCCCSCVLNVHEFTCFCITGIQEVGFARGDRRWPSAHGQRAHSTRRQRQLSASGEHLWAPHADCEYRTPVSIVCGC